MRYILKEREGEMRKEIEKIIREYSSDTDYSQAYWDECANQICELLIDRLESIPFAERNYPPPNNGKYYITQKRHIDNLIKELKGECNG